MLNLKNGDALRLTLGTTAVDVDWEVEYVKANKPLAPADSADPDNAQGTLAVTTPTDLLTNSTADTVLNCKKINVLNRHASTSTTVQLDRRTSAVNYRIFLLTLAAGEWLTISDGGVLFHHDINGGVYGQQLPVASDTVVGGIEIAVQSEMESGTSTTQAVVPGRLTFHPSSIKFWVMADMAGGNLASFNVASLTDGGAGILTVTIATDFSSTTWCCQVSIANLDASIDAIADGMIPMIANASIAAGSVQVLNKLDDGTGPADGQYWFVSGMGDQA